MRLFESTQVPSTRWYTLISACGPARIGLSSGTKIVLLAHPIADASTSTIKSSAIQVSIDRHGATVHAFLEPREEGEGDLCDDPVKHRPLPART